MFDTLVARRCAEPTGVFARLEQRSGLRNLAAARVAAEAAIAGSPYGLGDIYRVLTERHGLPAELGRKVMLLEVEIEREMLFPIAEICALFRPSDIVVSDMYLPHEFLVSVLRDGCGLVPSRLYLSSNGKRQGYIWESIGKEFQILEHFGDNEITDIQSASRAGLSARHVAIAGWTRVEVLLARSGFRPLAEIVREARLSTYQPVPERRQEQILQIELNFPLLFLASLTLARLAAQRGWKRILFSGRDGFLWSTLYQVLYPLLGGAPPARYFHSSRIARMRPSSSYLSYFEAERGGVPCVIADLVGTGWSLTRLIEQAADVPTDIFLIHHLQRTNLLETYQAHAPTRIPVAPISVLCREANEHDNEVLEELNRAPHPMITDIEETDRGFRPVSAPSDLDHHTRGLLAGHHAAFQAAVRLIPNIDPAALAAMAQQPTEAVMTELYREFGGQLPRLHAFRSAKDVDEALFLSRLRSAP
ncbi:MAG: hypothetical protein KGI51_02415 [Rhodospirillales bacterium]|nr:hypothetical protein [Rhodospirillales bacterium]